MKHTNLLKSLENYYAGINHLHLRKTCILYYFDERKFLVYSNYFQIMLLVNFRSSVDTPELNKLKYYIPLLSKKNLVY